MEIPYEECEKDERKNGINRIIRSMRTNQQGGYGDFGRYTWESAFNFWNVDVHGLSRYAIRMIFKEYGYDHSLHGAFDNSVGSFDRQQSQIERIGKKYQWIALHEMVARLSDNYPMEDRWSNRVTEYNGTWEPYIRDLIRRCWYRVEYPLGMNLNHDIGGTT